MWFVKIEIASLSLLQAKLLAGSFDIGLGGHRSFGLYKTFGTAKADVIVLVI